MTGDEGLELLVQVRERLLQITNRLTDIQATPIAGHVVSLMTLREFTEKRLNENNPNSQEAAYPSPRVQPRDIQRADVAPAGGYALVVDGHFKTQFESDAAAQAAAKELLIKYPMLQIAIYDAAAKARTMVKL